LKVTTGLAVWGLGVRLAVTSRIKYVVSNVMMVANGRGMGACRKGRQGSYRC
jgi:hypothetical protein